MAGQPFDYRLNVADPFAAATQGLQLGATMEQMQRQREDRARALAAEERARQQQAAMQERVMAFIDRPTAQGALALSALMPPDQAKSIREGWEMLDKDTQRGRLEVAGQALTALKMGKSDIAINLFRQYGEAARNSGDEDTAKAYETYAELTGTSPEGVMANLSGMIAPLPGGNELLENVFKEAKLPGEVREGAAKATTAEVEAKYADTRALLEIDEIKNDMEVKRLNSRIYAANAALSREANDLKRQELGLRIDEMVRERDQRARDKAAEAESTVATLDNTDSTIARILANKSLGSALGPIDSRLPTMRESTADVEALIDTLQSQTFLSQVSQMKGMGALTETEGKKLTASIQSLNMMQSEKQFRQNLESIRSLMQQAKNRVKRKYGSVAAPASADVDIDALVNKYLPGGM